MGGDAGEHAVGHVGECFFEGLEVVVGLVGFGEFGVVGGEGRAGLDEEFVVGAAGEAVAEV